MPISFRCAQCGSEQIAADLAAGETTHCGECGELLRVPGMSIHEESPETKKPIWQTDVSRLTVGGWIVALVSCGVGLAAMSSAIYLNEKFDVRLKQGAIASLVYLMLGFGASLIVGAGLLKLCGLPFTKPLQPPTSNPTKTPQTRS